MKYVKPLCLDPLNSLMYVYIYLHASILCLYLSSLSIIYYLLFIYYLSIIYLSIIYLSNIYLSIYLCTISSYRQSSIT